MRWLLILQGCWSGMQPRWQLACGAGEDGSGPACLQSDTALIPADGSYITQEIGCMEVGGLGGQGEGLSGGIEEKTQRREIKNVR